MRNKFLKQMAMHFPDHVTPGMSDEDAADMMIAVYHNQNIELEKLRRGVFEERKFPSFKEIEESLTVSPSDPQRDTFVLREGFVQKAIQREPNRFKRLYLKHIWKRKVNKAFGNLFELITSREQDPKKTIEQNIATCDWRELWALRLVMTNKFIGGDSGAAKGVIREHLVRKFYGKKLRQENSVFISNDQKAEAIEALEQIDKGAGAL